MPPEFSSESIPEPRERIDVLQLEVDETQEKLRARLQEVLSSLVGFNGGSFEANKEVARKVQRLLQSLDAKVRCPKTGLDGNLRHRKGGNAKFGTFQIEIVENGKRTSRYSSTHFPALEVRKANLSSPNR